MPIKKKRPYPWDKWFSKPKFVMIEGKDFTCQMHGAMQQVRNMAKEKGYKVSIHAKDGRIEVIPTKLPVKRGKRSA